VLPARATPQILHLTRGLAHLRNRLCGRSESTRLVTHLP
jgi:hypothetical protein